MLQNTDFEDDPLSISPSARFRHDFLCTTLRTRPAEMNTSHRSPDPQDGIMGNFTWNPLSYQTNFTLSPPLLPKTKTAACEQLHIAIEVQIIITFCIYLSICIMFINHQFSYFLSPGAPPSGLPDPGYHLAVGEHLGHHGYREEQEPSLSHVLLCLQVNVSLKLLKLVDSIFLFSSLFPHKKNLFKKNSCELFHPAII